MGTAKVVTPVLPEPLSGPVYIVQQAANPLPKLAVFLDGLVSIRLEAQNQIQHVQIVNTFDGVPDVPITSFELRINGGRNGILENFSSLCERELRGAVTFTAHSGKTFSDRPVLEAPPCEAASAAPRASIRLQGIRTAKPVLTVGVRRASGGAKLSGLKIKLPRALRGYRRMASRGMRVQAARKLGRAHSKLTRRAIVVRKLPAGGAASIRVVLRGGALQPAAALRSRASKRKLKFELRISDAAKHHFTLVRKVRPRP